MTASVVFSTHDPNHALRYADRVLLIRDGSPAASGPVADARACLRMAAEMHRRLEHLNETWRQRAADVRAVVELPDVVDQLGSVGLAAQEVRLQPSH